MHGFKGGRVPKGSRRRAGDVSPPTRARAPHPPVPPDAHQYFNRELSVLSFFRRVLEEAQDERNPLLERARFLSILGSILAEFFMVRVAGLKQQMLAGVVELSTDGRTPAEVLLEIRQVALELMRDARTCLQRLLPLLHDEGIDILDYRVLTAAQRAAADTYFEQVVFPVLTPLAFDPGRPFPYISNVSMNLAVLVRDGEGQERFARVKVPQTLPRLLPVDRQEEAPEGGSGTPPTNLVWLEQVIAANLSHLFPGMEVLEAHPFRVTRDAEMEIQQLEAEDLLETIERSVRERRFGSVVRVTVDTGMPPTIRDILTDNMGIEASDIYTLDPPLGTSDLAELHTLDRPALKFPPFPSAVPPALRAGDDPFADIRREDILLHHPYDSFAPVVDLLRAAARDPDVLAIKQTLYRIGPKSPVVESLLEAAANGKQVAVLVELKARFDEENNIGWARSLEEQGVHVVYGLPGLKIHSKILLLVRKEGRGIRRYTHLATGNYNPVTAHQYTDLGLLTCDEAFGADASDLFNFLTGYSAKREFRRFLVAPINLRTGFQALIEREIECVRQGQEGHLIFKLNHLADAGIAQALYRASRAGVKVDLVVRSTCILRPGVKGLSENIRITSIVGRFLEHSRVYYFRNGGKEEIYVGSADLMHRNLEKRVETLFPIQDPRLLRYLRDDVLAISLADTAKARLLKADGTHERVAPSPGDEPLNSQQWMIDHRARDVVAPS